MKRFQNLRQRFERVISSPGKVFALGAAGLVALNTDTSPRTVINICLTGSGWTPAPEGPKRVFPALWTMRYSAPVPILEAGESKSFLVEPSVELDSVHSRAIEAYIVNFTKWETRDPNHLVAWYVESARSPFGLCDYEYDPSDPQPGREMPDWMKELREHMMKTLNLPKDNPPNSVNMNYYKDGMAGIGPHSDDESLFQADKQPAIITSFSLGSERDFEVYEFGAPDETQGKFVTKVTLPNVSYMTMEGMFQRDYKHAIPQARLTTPPRLNMTWRWIVEPVEKSPTPERTKQAESKIHEGAKRIQERAKEAENGARLRALQEAAAKRATDSKTD